MEKLLSVGSVVRLNDIAEYEFMIMGYLQKMKGKLYDYIAVLYPNGMVGEDSCFFFNSKDIQEVVFHGYCDKNGEALVTVIPEVLKRTAERIYEKKKRDTDYLV